MTRQSLPVAAVVLGLAGTGLALFIDTQAATAAWLFALILAMSGPLGALTLLLTGKLTGGAWLSAVEERLTPLALLVPFAGLAFIPLLFFLPALYPWAAGPAHDPMVGTFYLDSPLVILRLAAAFAGWSVAAFVVVPMTGTAGQIGAGCFLIFQVIMTTLLGYDWILSLQSSATSTSFGAHLAILFLLTALALAALSSRLEAEKSCKDVAGLLIAGVLGTIYLDFMQFLIIWYGDLSDTAKFYLDRAGTVPTATLVAALLLGGLVPLVILISEDARRSPELVRMAAFFVLAGIFLHWCWSVFGFFPAAALVAAPGPLLLVGGGLWLAARLHPERRAARRETTI